MAGKLHPLWSVQYEASDPDHSFSVTRLLTLVAKLIIIYVS